MKISKIHTAFIVNKAYLFLLIVMVIVTQLLSCRNDNIPQNTDGSTVDVAIAFSLPDMEKKKTRYTLTDEQEKQIKNVYLFIFDAISGTKVYGALHSYDDENVEQRKLITQQKLLRDMTYRFYALANVDDKQTLFSISESSLNTIVDEEDLTGLMMKLPDNHLLTSRMQLFMSGMKEETISAPITGNFVVDVPLYRIDAKVTFNIKAAAGVTFNPHSFRIMRLPKGTLCFNNPDAVASTDKADYFDRSESFFEGDGSTFTFYMLENLSKKQKVISATADAYNERARREKISIDGAVDNPIVTNGNFVNAPINGTYVEITGEFKKFADGGFITAQTKYFVHLGYVDDTVEGGIVNDYAIHRNTHYTYNITVKDVNNLIAEAKSDLEPDSRTEGHVLKSKKDFELDAHYETVSVLLEWNRFFESNGKPKEIVYKVKTPFDEGINSNVDIDWVKFSPTPGNAYPEFRSYTDALNSGELYSINNLIVKIRNKEFPNFTKDSPLALTVFVDEFYYQKDPVDNTVSQTLWKKFVNKPDRYLLIAPTEHISADGNTTMDEAFLSIRQKSIKTFYNAETDYYKTAWGIETVMESERLEYAKDDHTVGRDSKGTSGKDGRYNTLREWQDHYGFFPWERTPMIEEGWNGALDFKENKMKTKYNYIRYACLTRNRDLNGNGKIDADEVRWYLPAIGQLLEIWMLNDAMPFESRLFKGVYEKLSFASSTPAKVKRSNNALTLWAQAASMFTGFGVNDQNNDDKKHEAYYRCVRNLGIPQNPNEEYPAGVSGGHSVETGLQHPQPFYQFDKTNNTFDLSNVNPKALRSSAEKIEKGELLPHHHLDPQDKLYRKLKIGQDYVKVGGVYFNGNFDKLSTALTEGKSPCKEYSELIDESDKGKWRVPNEREVALILRQSYDDGEPEPEHYWSCTTFAFPEQQFDNPSEFFQFQKGGLYNMINIKGGPRYGANNVLGRAKVRCVRDID